MRAALALAAVLLTGCANKQEAAPAAEVPPAPIPAAEVARGRDACAAYVAQVCACTAPAAAEPCKLAKALPEAIQVGLDVATRSEVDRLTIVQANDSVRKTFKQCIELVAKLPQLGC